MDGTESHTDDTGMDAPTDADGFDAGEFDARGFDAGEFDADGSEAGE